LQIYAHGAKRAAERGIILADTKFEFGLLAANRQGAAPDEALLLIDEVMTPDSSRFWPAEGYAEGRPQPSYDKQFVRDWLSASGWDKNSPPPELPPEVVERTRSKYIEAYERMTGQPFAWK
ncbi:MAG TPA: phosphoribosylaminoimidazolesuccinocarboxamide synthase, partial [Lacipirellulaceae bacterium]|nr:phosphoribosylaminoimidazolesuccinocarboxamide synthase [Lacipirellulaceae bacterium]